MLNEKNNKDFQKMEDSDLEKAVGGYLQVSQWRSYASTDLIPGASVVSAIDQLYSDCYANRGNIHSDAVRQALDTVVDRANNYLSTHA